jgi:hypothetical protein
MGGSAAAGFTLKREPPHELTNTRVQASTKLITNKNLRRKSSGLTFRFGLSVAIARILHVPQLSVNQIKRRVTGVWLL